ncbi:MAG: N-succinylarginine dihydrolase, partial [Pseudomonadota bacterium]
AADGRVHFTPANLSSHLHRSLEAPQTARSLITIFADERRFAHHDPLPMGAGLGDEGAANHTRLHGEGEGGAHIFVYGLDGERFRARQSRRASEAVARLHCLDPERTAFLAQSRRAIDAGAFHNDVVGVGDGHVYFFHEDSFEDLEAAKAEIRRVAPYAELIMAPADEVPLEDAIRSYLFNSQLLTLPDRTKTLVLPTEAEENEAARRFVEKTVEAENSIAAARYFDVRESMRNGGGPACLRLRVALTEDEVAAVHPGFLLTDDAYARLTGWVAEHYRDRLAPDDLSDPALARESSEALEALSALLGAPRLFL